jgi:hypothetical protein
VVGGLPPLDHAMHDAGLSGGRERESWGLRRQGGPDEAWICRMAASGARGACPARAAPWGEACGGVRRLSEGPSTGGEAYPAHMAQGPFPHLRPVQALTAELVRLWVRGDGSEPSGHPGPVTNPA